MNDGINLTPSPTATTTKTQLGAPGAVHARPRPAHAAGRGVGDGEDGAGGADDVPTLLQVCADGEMDWYLYLYIGIEGGCVVCWLLGRWMGVDWGSGGRAFERTHTVPKTQTTGVVGSPSHTHTQPQTPHTAARTSCRASRSGCWTSATSASTPRTSCGSTPRPRSRGPRAPPP